MRGRPNWFWTTFLSALTACVLSLAVAVGALPPETLYLSAAASVGAVFGAVRLESHRKDADESVDRHAEAEARASLEAQSQRDALDALADGIDTVVFLVAADGTVDFANLAACSKFRVEEPEGRMLLAVTVSQQLEDLVQSVIVSGNGDRQEVSFTHPVDWIGNVQVWPLKSDKRIFVAVTDVTHILRLEAVRRDFVANVSHEVRTPLSMVRLSAETLLEDHGEEPSAARHLARIVNEVDRLTRITDDLLVLSGAETRQAELENVDVSQLTDRACAGLFGVAVQKGLNATTQLEPGVCVVGDAVQLSQVVTNLVANAISYTQKGDVAVSVASEGGSAVVSVSDTGIGIASEHVPRIFERFYRADKARSRETGGTGLGLSIVRNIVEAHGGTVTVDTELNKGSTFIVRLPLAPRPD